MDLPLLTNFRVTRDPRNVVTGIVNVPGRTHNVFNEEALSELGMLVDGLYKDPTIRLVLFRSGKQAGFHAGGDLRWVYAIESRDAVDRLAVAGQELFDRIERLPMPTVAVIHGPCLGGGLEFALSCRYRLARDDERTRLGLPEVSLGLFPCWGGPQRLPKLVGLSAALDMILSGRNVSAHQAAELHLINAAFPADRFEEGVDQFVSDRLEGRPFRWRPSGWAARLRDRTRLGQALVLRGAPLHCRRQPARSGAAGRVGSSRARTPPGTRGGIAAGARSICRRVVQPGVARSAGTILPARARRQRNCLRTAMSSSSMTYSGAIPCGVSVTTATTPWVEGLTIGAVLRRTARRFGSRDAMIFCQAGLRLTWAELDEQVNRVARGLLAIGLQRGDHFGIWSTNWPEWVILQFATARIGVVLVTINPAYLTAEIEYALGQSEVRGLALVERFRSCDYFEMLREICPELDRSPPGRLRSARFPRLQWIVGLRGPEHPGMLAWRQLEAAAESVPASRLEEVQRQLEASDPINLQYTSGTTGAPKGALLSHRNLLLNAFHASEGQRLDERDRICIPVPLYHCFGCVLGTLCAAVRGAAMVFPSEGFEPAAALKAVESERCTAIYGVPTMFIMEMEHASFAERDLSSLRTGIMAGSPCPIELMKRVVKQMGAREITIAYGQTEASPLVAMTRSDDPVEKRVATVGRPLPGIEVRIVELGSGRELPDGRSGELCCRGHNVMLGYYHMPESTTQAIDAEGWLHTGDMALRQPDGYYRITGRIKEHDRPWRREHRPARNRRTALSASQGRAGTGRGRAGSEIRRRNPGVDPVACGGIGHGKRDPRLLPRSPGAL